MNHFVIYQKHNMVNQIYINLKKKKNHTLLTRIYGAFNYMPDPVISTLEICQFILTNTLLFLQYR